MKIFEVKIEIRPADGVLDPEGKAVLSTIGRLGFGGVRSATVGKLVELTVEADDEDLARKDARRLCEEFLSNPVIEVFSIEVSPGG